MHRPSPRPLLPGPRRLQVGAAVGAALLVAAAFGIAARRSSGGGVPEVAISAQGCGTGWGGGRSGITTFSVRNATATTQDVVLERSDQQVVAEIPTLGPGVVRPVRVSLEPGRYSWRCVSVDGEITLSGSQLVTGLTVSDPSPGYQPVISDDLTAAADNYRALTTAGLKVLVADVDRLTRAVDGSQTTAAMADWLTAHLDYERLGAAYGTFGDFDTEINGRADGLARGVDDPAFEGFHRLEYGLWHHQAPATVTAVANQLDHNVHALQAAFPHQLLPATDLPLRAHEILENALQFELTGDTDEGSHTNLATVRANVDGTDDVLGVLTPLLQPRDPKLLATARAQLATLADQLDAYRSPAGVWTPLDALTIAEREQLDGSTDAALASLDQVPAQLEQASGDNS